MNTHQALATIPTIPTVPMASLGQAANAAAAHSALSRYQKRKSQQTLRRQAADIALFAQYLAVAGLVIEDLSSNLEAWSGVTYGLVDGFNEWQLQEGYAIGSINVRLATIKAYSKLAAKAGYILPGELTLIRTVTGFKGEEGRNINEKRTQAGTRTRYSERGKKASPVSLSKTHADMLKKQPADTKKGRRDTLLMCLLLDHGLRVGEIAALDIAAINLEAGTLVFYRRKVDKTQTHQLTPDTWRSAKVYLEQDCSEQDQASPLFTGPCSKSRISERTINARLAALGCKNDLEFDSLSPHDCRHYWATQAVRNGTDIKSLQDAGGWSSPAMPLRYAESSKIANAGVKLG